MHRSDHICSWTSYCKPCKLVLIGCLHRRGVCTCVYTYMRFESQTKSSSCFWGCNKNPNAFCQQAQKLWLESSWGEEPGGSLLWWHWCGPAWSDAFQLCSIAHIKKGKGVLKVNLQCVTTFSNMDWWSPQGPLCVSCSWHYTFKRKPRKNQRWILT